MTLIKYKIFPPDDPLFQSISTNSDKVLTQGVDDFILKEVVKKDLNHYLDNPYNIHQDTFCLFYTLARQLQKYLTMSSVSSVNVEQQYLKYAKLCLRQCSTVDCNLVGAHSDHIDVNGEWELWLDDDNFTVDDRLGRLYCLIVGYLKCPKNFESMYKRKY